MAESRERMPEATPMPYPAYKARRCGVAWGGQLVPLKRIGGLRNGSVLPVGEQDNPDMEFRPRHAGLYPAPKARELFDQVKKALYF